MPVIWKVKKISHKMLAVPKDSSSYWKTDYMLSKFRNKQGVKYGQNGIGKKARTNSK